MQRLKERAGIHAINKELKLVLQLQLGWQYREGGESKIDIGQEIIRSQEMNWYFRGKEKHLYGFQSRILNSLDF